MSLFFQARLVPLLLSFVCVVTAACAPLAAIAQDQGSDPLRTAESLIRQGALNDGIAILDSLFQDSPAEYRFYSRLKDALAQARQYERAAEVAAKYLEVAAPTPSAYADKGRLHHEAGNVEAANDSWNQALSLAPDDLQTYQVVFRAMTDVQRIDEAIEVIHTARDRLNEPFAFEHQLPYLLAVSGRYQEAAEEFARVLHNKPERLNFVKRRIEPFFERNDAHQPLLAGASRIVRDHSSDQVLREFMAWLYIQDEQYDKALDATRAADELGDQDGSLLFEFAEKAVTAGALSEAIDALELVVDQYAQAAYRADARYLLGKTHFAASQQSRSTEERENHYAAALEHLSWFIDRYPQHESYPEVLQLLGEIQLEHLNDYEEARATLQRVRAEMEGSAFSHDALFNLARLALLEEEFEEAEQHFKAVHESGRPELAHRAALERARLALLRGERQDALALATEAASVPESDGAREAIRLRVLLIENKQAPDTTALQQYATAELRYRQKRLDEAFSLLNDLIEQHSAYPLADDARLLRAKLLHERGQVDAARTAYAEMASESPSSPLADQGLFEAARLYEDENPDRAQELYLQILSDYPGSLHAPDARQRLRHLRSN